MFKIVKWGVVGVVVVSTAGFILFGSNALNYASTAVGSVKDSVRGQIPIEFELKRAENLIQDIGPQIMQCKRDVALQEVQLDNLTADVARLERVVARAERKLKVGADMLAGGEGQSSYELAGGVYSRERVEIDLERTFDAFRQNGSLLESKRALIERQTRAVAAARSKLDAVRAEEARLVGLVGQLKTQKAQVDALKASSRGFALDDSALGQAKEVLAQVKERLDVAQKMLADDMFFQDGIAMDAGPTRDIITEIQHHFRGGEQVDVETAALGGEAAMVERR